VYANCVARSIREYQSDQPSRLPSDRWLLCSTDQLEEEEREA
jgi:hypothetical protein